MTRNRRGSLEGHLASFEDAFGDGEATYWKEIEERQKKPRSRRIKPKKTSGDTTLPKGVVVRSEQRDTIAEKIREAQTHEEKMAIARAHHESVNNPDRYVFPKKWQRELLAKQNRTALRFNKENTK